MNFPAFCKILLNYRGEFTLIKTRTDALYAIRHKQTGVCPIAWVYAAQKKITPDWLMNETFKFCGESLGLSSYLIESIAAAADNKEGKYTKTNYRVKLLEALDLEEGYEYATNSGR